MIVGVSARPEEMDVNCTREKQLTNMRSSVSDVLERMTPPTDLSLEQAISGCARAGIGSTIAGSSTPRWWRKVISPCLVGNRWLSTIGDSPLSCKFMMALRSP